MIKPDQTDFYNVEDFNSNVDIIDAELKRISDEIGSGGAGDNILARLNALETHVGNLNNLETTQKANLVAAINEVRKIAINAWQKGVYNDTDIINLGPDNAVRTFSISPSDWKSSVNVEQFGVYLPINGAFSGIIKATYNSTWGNLEAWGGVEVVYEIGSFLSSLKLNRATIITASEQFTESYKVLPATVDNTTGHIALILLKAPRASNPLKIKVEIQGYFHTSQTVFDVLKNTTIHIDDVGSPNYGGYPWTPQTSSFVQHSTGNNYILGGAMTLGGNFSISKGVPLIEMGVPSSTTNASAQILLNAGTNDDFGLEIRKNNQIAVHIQNQKHVAFLGHDNVWFTVQDLKSSVSNGKSLVANAITDMGVATSPTAEFATMAANIRNLSNIVSGTGTITNNSSQTIFAVSGLSFYPRAIMFRAQGGNIYAWGMYNRVFTSNEFITVIGNTSMANVFSVFQGGFDVKAAYPGGTGVFDWWAIK